MTPEEEDVLLHRVATLTQKVEDLTAEIDSYRVNGLADAFNGAGQQRFGGNIVRLDNHGIQFKKSSNPASGSRGFTALFFVDPLTVEPGYASDRAYYDGVAVSGGSTIAGVTAVSGSGADGTGGTTAALFVTANNTTGETYIRLRSIGIFEGVTADPAVFEDGMVWYRSDTDILHARINGVSENVATEAYVTANAGGTVKTEQMITPFSWCSLGVQLSIIASTAPANAAYPTANKAFYIPFTLDESTTFTKAFWVNGGVSGNVDIGIYNEAGTKQVSIGSTAQSGLNAVQTVDIADTTLAAGRYYMALACDNTTSNFLTKAVAANYQKTFGVATEASAFPLPSTATLAASADTLIPYFGFSIRTLVS